MSGVRTAPTAFRFAPEVKLALGLIAHRQGRSMANMMEWLIRQHCEAEGLGWPPSSQSKANNLSADDALLPIVQAKAQISAKASPTKTQQNKKDETK